MATLHISYTTYEGGWGWPIHANQDAWDDSISFAFTPTAGIDIEQIKLMLWQTGTVGNGDVWIEIWDDDSGVPGSIIANGTSSTLDASTVAGSTTEYTFTFATPPSVTGSTQYWIVVLGDTAYDSSNYVTVQGDNNTANPTNYGDVCEVYSDVPESWSYPGYTPWNEIYAADSVVELSGTVAAVTAISDPELTVSGPIALSGTAAAVTNTSTPHLAGPIALSGTAAAVTAISDPDLDDGSRTWYYMRADGTASSVANATGPDTNASACMSLTTHNNGSFSAGDGIYVSDKGGDYRGQLSPPSSGSTGAGNDILYRNIGTPVFKGSNLITGWTVYSGSVYQATVTTQPRQVFVDGTFGERQTSAGACTSQGDWYWASNTLYLYDSAGDPDNRNSPGIEAGQRDYACSISGVSYVTIDGLTFKHANWAGCWSWENSDYTVRNCIGEWNFYNGFANDGDTGSTWDNWLIEDCHARDNGSCGIIAIFGLQDSTIRRNKCYRNGAHHRADLDDDLSNTAGIKLYADVQAMEGIIVEQNECYENGQTGRDQGSGTGIWFDALLGNASNPCVIQHNYIHDNVGSGVFIEICSNAVVRYNLIVDNAQTDGIWGGSFAPAGISLDSRSTWATDDNLIYGNHVCGDHYYGMKLVTYEQTGSTSISDNIVRNNIIVGSTYQVLYCEDGGDNDGVYGTGNTFNNNCLGAEATDFIHWNGVDYDTYDAWLSASSQTDNNIEADPSFEDDTSDEYWLASDSPCIGEGVNLGAAHDDALRASSTWPDGVVTGDQDSYGAGWEIGAFLYEPSGSAINLSGTAAAATSTSTPALDAGRALSGTAAAATSTSSVDLDVATGNTYHMRADGTAANKAAATGAGGASTFMDVATHNSETFSAGDTIVLHDAGGPFRATLTPPSSGSSGSPITYEAASGDSPILSGADLLTGWSESGTSGALTSDADTVALWDFTNNLDDTTANGRDLTLDAGSLSYTDSSGNLGYYATFDGNDYATYDDAEPGDANAFDFGTSTSFTAEVWFRTSDDSGNVLGLIGKGSFNPRWEIFLETTGYVKCILYDGSTVDYCNSSGDLRDGEWHHLALVVDWADEVDNRGSLWVDGVRVDQTSAVLDGNWNTLDSSTDLNIGTDRLHAKHFVGDVAQVRISDIARTSFPSSPGSMLTNTWEATLASDPAVVIVNDVCYERVSDHESLSTQEWDYDSGKVYLFSTTDPDTKTVEVAARDRAIDVNGKSYLAFDGLRIEGAKKYSIEVRGALSNVSIEDCEFFGSGRYHIVSDPDDFQDDVTIRGNSMSYSGGIGIVVANRTRDWLVKSNTIDHAGCLDRSFDGGDQEIYWAAGIKLVDGFSDTVLRHIVEENEVTNSGYSVNSTENDQMGFGIWVDLVRPTSSTDKTVVRFNRVSGGSESGLFCEKTWYSEWYGNISFDNVGNGLRVDADEDGPAVHDNLFYNNSMYGNAVGIYCAGGYSPTGDRCYDNEFKNNIASGNTTRELVAKWGGENDGTYGSGNVFDYNCLGVEGTNFIEWGAGVYKSTYDAWETSYGSGTNSIESDPSFTNAANGDFTLQSGSPCIDEGFDLGAAYDDALMPSSSWPDGVVTGDQDSYGAGWEIGAFLYEPSGSAINLSGAAAAATSTSTPALDAGRALSGAAAAATTTTAASLAVVRAVSGSAAAATTTTTVLLPVGRALSGAAAASTATSPADLASSRSLAGSVAVATTTTGASLAVVRAVSGASAAVTSTAAAELVVTTTIALSGTAAAVTQTGGSAVSWKPEDVTTAPEDITTAPEDMTSAAGGDPELLVDRALSGVTVAETQITDPELEVPGIIGLTGTAAAATATASPELAVARALTGTVAASTATSTPALDANRALSGAAAAETQTSTPSLEVSSQIDLSGSASAATSTTTASLAVVRALSGSLAAASSTTAADLVVDRPLTGAVAAETATSTPTLNTGTQLAGSVAATTSTSSPEISIERALSGVAAAVTETSAAELDVTGFVALSGTAAVVTTTTAAELAVDRALSGAADCATSASAHLVVARPLTGAVAAATQISDPVLGVADLIELSGAVAAATSTTAAALSVARHLAATAAAQTQTSGVELDLTKYLSGVAAAGVQTSSAALAVLRPLSGVSAAVTTTSAATLVLGILGTVVDTALESITVERTFESVTPIRAPTNVD